MFDEKTKAELGYYVYFLKDPTEKYPFYVGKGKDNRVFAHLACAIENANKSDKLDKIRKIIKRKRNNEIDHIILRHGLLEKEAFLLEATMIDFLEYLNTGLTNDVLGMYSIEKGLMTSDEIIRRYNAEPLKDMDTDCIIININRNYKRGLGKDGIYEATKGCWSINKSRLIDKNGNILRKYVLSEFQGLIVEVFKVDKWYQKERGYGPNAKKHGQTKLGMCFDGKIAPEKIRSKYINKSIFKRKGEANIIK